MNLEKLARWLDKLTPPPEVSVLVHFVATTGWAICLPVAFITGWVYLIVFVSACSIYANFAAHWGALEASIAAVLAKRSS